jgi:hypothetical protein
MGKWSPVGVMAVTLVATSAHADAKACVAAAEAGQSARAAQKLVNAKASFALCAAESCPGPIRSECERLLGEVDAAIPTAVFGATIEGQDAVLTRVLVDGILVTDRIDGRAVEIDPGPHVIRFEATGRAPIERTVVLREGEKRRAIDASWASAPSSVAAPDAAGTARATVSVVAEPDQFPILEARQSGRWRLICSGSCDQPLPLDHEYRLNGRGVPRSTAFTLDATAGGHVRVGIKSGDDGGRKAGTIATVVGVSGLVIGITLISIAAANGSQPLVTGTTAPDANGNCPQGYNYQIGLGPDGCQSRSLAPFYAMWAGGFILGIGGLATFVTGLVVLATGRADVTQSTVARTLSEGVTF